MSEIPKKKRGRKPKNKIISNPDPIFDSNSLDNILITCIKKPESDILINENDIKPSDNSENYFQEYKHSNNKKCWNCSYNIDGEVYSYPINYFNNLFKINGNFCCYQCAARYIYENYNDKEFLDKYYLLNFYVNIKYNKLDKIKIPYSKLRLIDYGGDLTKQEYIDSENITYDSYIPPTVYVNNVVYNKSTSSSKGSDFKLSRKNKKINSFIKNLT
tara:strand:+ start:11 stop:658 length:648 start_codon:yes stop_codon:yes gene_type:complete